MIQPLARRASARRRWISSARSATLPEIRISSGVPISIEGDWAPGYYFFVFEDPDGIRLGVNFVPGKGLLASDTPLSPSDDPDWDQNSGPPRF